jgi:hypothetical protein
MIPNSHEKPMNISRYMHAKNDPRLVRFLDGLQYTLALIRLQYSDICGMIAKQTPDDHGMIMRSIYTAWGIVDSVHRIRELSQSIPGFSGSDQRLKLFLEETKIAEQFRHYIQHLRQELSKAKVDEFPVWGSFSWVGESDDHVVYTVLTGTPLEKTVVESCVYDTVEGCWVSKATLTIHGLSFHIDPIVAITSRFAEYAIHWIEGVKSIKIGSPEKLDVITARVEIIP